MDGPYRLGFEIVAKNEDATRLLGIFAFRTGDELLYAPVFFLNGDIKGTSLLYRHRVKRFLPMNEKIVKRLIARTRANTGGGVNRDFTRRHQQGLHLDRVAFPPATYKKASAEIPGFNADELAAEFLRQAPTPDAQLGEFIDQRGGAMALEKLAALMESVPAFAAACYERLAPTALRAARGDSFAADLEVEAVLRGLDKRASAEERENVRRLAYTALAAPDRANVKVAAAFFGEERLVLAVGEAAIFNKKASVEERDRASRQGYDLQDSRKDLKPAIVDYHEDLSTLSRPGVHSVLNAEGENTPVIALVINDTSLSRLRADYVDSPNSSPPCCSEDSTANSFICFTRDAKAERSQSLHGADVLVVAGDESRRDRGTGISARRQRHQVWVAGRLLRRSR